MLRGLLWLVLALLLLIALALGAAWWWTGSEGSLATALRLAGRYQPLVSEGVRGSLRQGGQIERLRWAQDGLSVELRDFELRWTPAALWQQRRLHIDRLAAAHVQVTDESTPDPDKPASKGPPELPALPLDVLLDELALGEVVWAGPPEFRAQDIQARAAFKDARLHVNLKHVQAQDGHWQGRVLLDAEGPMRLDTVLAGALQVALPGGEAAPALALLARVHGPLSDMQAQAQLHELDASDLPISAVTMPALPPEGSELPKVAVQEQTRTAVQASARIAPWQAQPLPEAWASFQALDAGALFAQAPRTRLNGALALQPVTQDGVDGWAVQAEIDNAAPGPWDAGTLPLQALQADVLWLDGVADVRQLVAKLGGGTLSTQGRWVAPPEAEETGSATEGQAQTNHQALGDWQLLTRLEGIDPSALHSELAPFPLDGDIRVSGQDLRVDFEAHILPAQGQGRQAGAGATAQARALAQQLQSLRLGELKLAGSWNEPALELRELLLRTRDAEISGTAQAEIDAAPERLGGQARLNIKAPGLRAVLDGSAWAERGDGQLALDVQDAAQLLVWARSLPGADEVLRGWQARGQSALNAQWQGGWRKPRLKVGLKAPRLSVQLPDTSADQVLALRDLQLDVAGGLDAVQLNVQGQLQQAQRRVDVRLQADGRNRQPDADPVQAAWDMHLGPWRVSLHDPELGERPWELDASQATDLSWNPAQGGQLALQPGSVQLRNAGAPERVQITWGPLRWQAGELTSTGRLTGLPMAWADLVAGPALAEAGIAGDVVFDGNWDVVLGREPRLQAVLQRQSGDIRLLNMGSDSATEGRNDLPLGLKAAELRLSNDGADVQAQLLWDSAQAGRIEAQLGTRLARAGSAPDAAWDWPAAAPLQGRVQLALPQLSTWSLLAPPGWRLRGALQGDLALSGTRDDPQLHGELSAERLALRSVVDGVQLGRGTLRARLQGTRLLIDEFTLHGPGREGQGGSLTAQGEAGLIDGRTQARITARLDGLRASVRSDRQLALSGQLQAGFAHELVQVEGDLHVDQAWIELPDDSAPGLGSDVYVHKAKDETAGTDTADAEAAQVVSPLRVQARVDIDLGKDFRLHGMGIDTRLTGLLKLRADGPLDAMPTMTGEIRTEAGSFRAYGQNLGIERGVIAFKGEIDNPSLDILALRPNYTSDQRVGVLVQGNALLPQVRLYSMPQLSDNQTLSWLLLGRAAPDSGAEAAMLQTAALAVLGGRDGGMAGKFGLDELGFNSNGDDGLAGSSLTVGKRLSDKLYAAYEHSLAGASGTLLIFYELSRRWSLRGQTGEDSAVDLIFRLSFD